MEKTVDTRFAIADYVVFIALLVVPSFIGVYFAYKDRKSSSTSNYFFGEKKLNAVAVGISTAVTSISAITMIGYPAEVYIVGTVYIWAPIAIILATMVTIVYYLPFYNNLELETIYAYLELRFNKSTRRIVAVMVPLSEVFFMGTVAYIPALALSAVTPITVPISIGITGGICTFYTVLGGIKAVVWTDVVQSLLMLGGSILVLTCGIVHLGGFGELEAALSRGERLTFMSFDKIDISSRMSPLAILVGEFFVFNHYLGFSQPIFQRIQSCRNKTQSQYAIIAYIIPAITIIFIAIGNGLLYYAFFEGCDPVESGILTSRDQGMPYIALHLFKNIPGLSGLYVAAVFSGSLSTVSSGINAYSIVIVEDFMLAIYPRASEKLKLFAGKTSALLLGVIVTFCGYMISTLGSNIFKILRSLMGAVGGPVFGIYILGLLFPWANSTGAIAGVLVGYAFMVWVFLGSIFLLTAPPRIQLPPITTDLCPLLNGSYTTMSTLTSSITTLQDGSASEGYRVDQLIYSINFHYYILTGALVTIVTGLIASGISGFKKPQELDPKLFLPIFDNKRFPDCVRKFFRCGVPKDDYSSCHKNKKTEASSEDVEENFLMT
uniref:sodium-coupled monocarboxylate transporter 2-like n=1 Tax=Styela clava TaxID=7725 RepID=UPI00193A81E3|nr:sodium-coupled monocarboxylate transporter 2-like [Styela clava]